MFPLLSFPYHQPRFHFGYSCGLNSTKKDRETQYDGAYSSAVTITFAPLTLVQVILAIYVSSAVESFSSFVIILSL